MIDNNYIDKPPHIEDFIKLMGPANEELISRIAEKVHKHLRTYYRLPRKLKKHHKKTSSRLYTNRTVKLEQIEVYVTNFVNSETKNELRKELTNVKEELQV
jgi:hypothetical protein